MSNILNELWKHGTLNKKTMDKIAEALSETENYRSKSAQGALLSRLDVNLIYVLCMKFYVILD